MKDAPAIWLWRGYFYKPLSPPQAEELRVAYVGEIDKMQECDPSASSGQAPQKFNQGSEQVT